MSVRLLPDSVWEGMLVGIDCSRGRLVASYRSPDECVRSQWLRDAPGGRGADGASLRRRQSVCSARAAQATPLDLHRLSAAAFVVVTGSGREASLDFLFSGRRIEHSLDQGATGASLLEPTWMID